MDLSQNLVYLKNTATADNTAYTLRAFAPALRDIAPFSRNLVYAWNVIWNPENIMNHINARKVFSERIIREIQKYYSGGYLWLPRQDYKRTQWEDLCSLWKRIFEQEPTILPNIWQSFKSLLSFLRSFIKENIFWKEGLFRKIFIWRKAGGKQNKSPEPQIPLLWP